MKTRRTAILDCGFRSSCRGSCTTHADCVFDLLDGLRNRMACHGSSGAAGMALSATESYLSPLVNDRADEGARLARKYTYEQYRDLHVSCRLRGQGWVLWTRR